MKTIRAVLLLTCLALVAACGTRGDLVLPDKADKPDTAEAAGDA